MPEEKIVNDRGGIQSDIGLDWRYIPWDAVIHVCNSLTRNASEHGGDYKLDNWRKISSRDHANHAINHLIALYLKIDREGIFNGDVDSDAVVDELMAEAVHAANRCLMTISKLMEEIKEHGRPDWEPRYPVEDNHCRSSTDGLTSGFGTDSAC